MMKGITQFSRRHISSSLILLSTGVATFPTTPVASASVSSNSSTSFGEKYKPALISSIAIKGRRPHMEDEVVISEDNLYAAVFDGKKIDSIFQWIPSAIEVN
jgi:hypothetical protein